MQLLGSGEEDPLFGTEGVSTWPEPGAWLGRQTDAQVVQSADGTIVFPFETSKRGAVARLATDGKSFVTGFGSGNRIVLSKNVASLVQQSDGKLLIAQSDPSSLTGTITRFGPNGQADPSFGEAGSVSVSGIPKRTVLQSDGRLVVLSWIRDRDPCCRDKAKVIRLWR